MSVVGRVYLITSLSLLMLGIIWGFLTLVDNRDAVEVVIFVPRMDAVDPFSRERFLVNASALMAGWGITVCVVLLLAIRAPFRVRSAALTQRRIRDLEREVLELRRLPLRQQEEDEILAAEAHLDARGKKVMTEKLRLEAQEQGERATLAVSATASGRGGS